MNSRKLKIVILSVFIMFTACPYRLMADADPSHSVPSPGENVLLIYTTCTQYNIDLKDYYKSRLLAISSNTPTVQELKITCGNMNGIYDELQDQYGASNLSQWCQVYDLRFMDTMVNLSWTGAPQEDVITYTGANSDYNLFDAYLSNGGSIFLQGEHHDFYRRNTNLFMFINHAATVPIAQANANVTFGAQVINNFPVTPEDFNLDFNNISGGSFNANFAGGITLTMLGSGRSLMTANLGAASGAPGGQSAVAAIWLPTDLKAGAGRLVVNFETNSFAEVAYQNATTSGWIQNVYDMLSGCYRYDLTKTFTPSEVCVGGNGQFTIAYNNTGSKALSNVAVWDTIPTCLGFTSSVPAPSGGPVAVTGGNLYWWNITSVAGGATGSVVVNYNVTCLP